MTFPSTNGTRQGSLAIEWTRARDTAGAIKSLATSTRAASASGNISASAVLRLVTALADSKLSLQKSSSATGIAAYAQAQIADNTINIAVEFGAMVSALDAVVSWVVTNFPKDGNGFLLGTQFLPDNTGRTIDRQFSPAETAGLRTVLDALIATID